MEVATELLAIDTCSFCTHCDLKRLHSACPGSCLFALLDNLLEALGVIRNVFVLPQNLIAPWINKSNSQRLLRNINAKVKADGHNKHLRFISFRKFGIDFTAAVS